MIYWILIVWTDVEAERSTALRDHDSRQQKKLEITFPKIKIQFC